MRIHIVFFGQFFWSAANLGPTKYPPKSWHGSLTWWFWIEIFSCAWISSKSLRDTIAVWQNKLKPNFSSFPQLNHQNSSPIFYFICFSYFGPCAVVRVTCSSALSSARKCSSTDSSFSININKLYFIIDDLLKYFEIYVEDDLLMFYLFHLNKESTRNVYLRIGK